MSKRNPFKQLAKKLEATADGRALAVEMVGATDPAAADRLRRKYAAAEHRRLYPEQYDHALVGKRVAFNYGGEPMTGTVTRVMQTRFGQLAEIDTLPQGTAIALVALQEVR